MCGLTYLYNKQKLCGINSFQFLRTWSRFFVDYSEFYIQPFYLVAKPYNFIGIQYTYYYTKLCLKFLLIQTNNLTHFIGEILEDAKTSEMAQRKSRHTELSDSLSETKSVPSAPSDRLTTTTTTESSDSHSQLSIATPSPLPVVSNQEFAATSNTVKEIPKPPAKPAAKSTVSTGVGPSPPREIPTQISESKPVQTSAVSSDTLSATETQATKFSTEIQATESRTNINAQFSCKSKMVTSTGTSPPPQSISTQVM